MKTEFAGEDSGRQMDLQRKIQPLQHGLEAVCSNVYQDVFLQALPSDAAAVMRRQQEAGRRQSIIIVASLLDRVPNLAGLTRTCEVFQAKALVLADLSVTKQSEFAGISVTAERHMPLLVCSTILSCVDGHAVCCKNEPRAC